MPFPASGAAFSLAVRGSSAAQGQHSVHPAKGEGIAERHIDLRRASLIRYHIQRALRIGFFIADGGRDHPVPQRHDAGQKLNRTGAADHMAVHRFGR